MLSAFEWFVLVLPCGAFVIIVLSDEPRARVGRRKLVKARSNFIDGCATAALLFCLFGDFRCGMLLLIVSLAIFIQI